jgi:hypothetical protein
MKNGWVGTVPTYLGTNPPTVHVVRKVCKLGSGGRNEAFALLS